MRKYNYFDDDPQELEPKKLPKINIDFRGIARGAKQSALDIIHGTTFEDFKEIKEMPNLRSVMLKLFAFFLFLVAVVIFILAFSHSITAQNEKNSQYYTDAGKVCTEYIKEFGTAKWERLDSDTYGKGMTRLTGLCYARQMDFNRDGDDELMLCYNNRNIYTLEVWGYKGDEFVKLYSEEANHTENNKDGSWIAFHYKNNKYYICKSEPEAPEKVTMYALKGDTFKADGECDYDYRNNIYSVKGKINASDFETIKLSVIKSSKAEVIVNTVTENIDSFNTVSVASIQSQKTPEEIKAEAYYKIIESRNEKYGKGNLVKNEGEPYLDGLSYVSLVDFDGDENEELLLVYRKKIRESATNAYNGEFIIIEKPAYCVEVYSWNGSVAKKVFSRDSISNYLNDSDTNYLMLKTDGKKVDICFNSYSDVSSHSYTASSRIYEFKDGEFVSTFSAKEENSYGYKDYYLDGKYSYRSDFTEKAFQVPKFLDDSQDYDNSKYTLIYFSGDGDHGYDSTIENTVKTIQSLNKNYIPE